MCLPQGEPSSGGEPTRVRRGGNHSKWRPAMVQSMVHGLLDGVQDLNKAIKGMVTHFNNANEGHGIAKLKSAFKRLINRLQIDGSYADRARTGRPQRVTQEQVRHCVHYFKKGVGTERTQWYGFTSIEHAAVECPEIVAVLAETGVSVDTLWGRMRDMQHKEHKHGFRKITICIKPALTPEVKQERLEKAAEWARMSLEDLMCVFWIDEKQEYVVDKAYKCYAPDDATSYSVESHYPLGKYKKLKYIACVNAVLGPVYIALISGTSDFDSGFTVNKPVQGKAGKQTVKAGNLTKDEFAKHLAEIANKVHATWHTLNLGPARFAFDNPRNHDLTPLQLFGCNVGTSNVLRPPRYSGDFMQCIEHVHSYVCAEFHRQRFREGRPVFDLKKDGDRLRKVFNDEVTADSVLNDCMRVMQLVEHVRKSDGGYAPVQMT